jgi:Transposase DDE domain
VQEECTAYRHRLYPPLTTLGLFVGQTLSADGACQDAVARHLSERTARHQSPCSLNTGPYCKARSRLPIGLIRRAGEMVEARLAALEESGARPWTWHGRRVTLLDGTTVSMPDTPDNQTSYPQSGAQKPGLGFPLVNLVALISLATGAVRQWALGPCRGKHTGEQALFRRLMPSLKAGEVILVDRYHCNYFTAAMLQEQGVDLVTQQHQRRHTDFRRGTRLGKRDHLVDWLRPQRPSWMDQDTYARMPERLTMRETKIANRVVVSTFIDAQQFTARALDGLYALRWQIEVDLRSIKTHMGMEVLSAKTAAMVAKEVAVYLLAYNLVRALMSRAALTGHHTGNGKPSNHSAGNTQKPLRPRLLAFKSALQLLLAFQQQLRLAAPRNARRMIAILIGGIASCTIPIRPHRIEPRAVKRRPKPHPFLTVPRNLARDNIRKQPQSARA